MVRMFTAVAATTVAIVAAAGRAQPLETTGTLEEVTVFRGQALVGRRIDVPGAAGLREIVVTGLPESLQPASLYAEGGDGVEVRSVRYRVRPASEDARAEVAKLEKAIREAQDQLEAAHAKEKLMEWHRAYLDRIENFIAATGTVEMGKGVLNAETITKLFEFANKERAAKSTEFQALRIQVRELEEKVGLLQRELAQISSRSSRTAREAVVFVNSAKPGAIVRLNYIVDRATWSPSYILRSGESEGVVVEYQASIQQLSGEDWTNVKMTLSTATPALVASGPTLEPLRVALVAPGQGGKAGEFKDKAYGDAKKELAQRQQMAEASRNQANQPAPGRAGGQSAVSQMDFFDQRRADENLNELAGQGQLLDLWTTESLARKPGDRAAAEPKADESVSVSYEIVGRTTMPSRADQQLIQIARLACPAKQARVATPLLTQYVYLESTVTNSGDVVLLAGPSASYVAGRFVGRGGVPTVAAGETFTAGFGIDTSLRTGRELVERTETIQGGNRVVEFTYKLTLENFGKNPAAVRLQDRMPHPKGPEMKATMVSSNAEVSKDPRYEATEKKNGLLRWDVLVPPGASGTTAMAVEYKFRLEYDKQMTVGEGK